MTTRKLITAAAVACMTFPIIPFDTSFDLNLHELRNRDNQSLRPNRKKFRKATRKANKGKRT